MSTENDTLIDESANENTDESADYEYSMIDELSAIVALLDTHVDYYFCAPGQGYVIVYRDLEGSHLAVNHRGLTYSMGPWTSEKASRRFQSEVEWLKSELVKSELGGKSK